MTLHNVSVIWLRGGWWCAVGWIGDECLSEYAYRRDDALAKLHSAAAFKVAL